MDEKPPPLPRRLSKAWIVTLVCVPLMLVAALVGVVVMVGRSGITRPIDNIFGDQHLKTVVALVELHKVRYGAYPERLADLKFTGEWDQMHIQMSSYCAAPDRQSYYVEVERGWAFKPRLTMPSEFWRGTGFDASLGPCKGR